MKDYECPSSYRIKPHLRWIRCHPPDKPSDTLPDFFISMPSWSAFAKANMPALFLAALFIFLFRLVFVFFFMSSRPNACRIFHTCHPLYRLKRFFSRMKLWKSWRWILFRISLGLLTFHWKLCQTNSFLLLLLLLKYNTIHIRYRGLLFPIAERLLSFPNFLEFIIYFFINFLANINQAIVYLVICF